MRWLKSTVVIVALLHPLFCIAQCEGEDWFTFTTFIPSGNPQGQNNFSTERFVVSSVDGSVYRADFYGSGTDGLVNLLINNEEHQFQTLPNERVLAIQKLNALGQLQWLKTGSVSNSSTLYGLTVDESGNIYFGGTFNGVFTYDGDTLFESQSSGHFTLKVLPSGDLGWHRAGSRGTAVRHTWSDHGLLMLISLTDSITFNGQVYHKQTPVMPSTNEYLVLMVDAFGEVIWHKFVSGLGLKTTDAVSCGHGKCLLQGRFTDDLAYGAVTYNNGQNRLFQIALRTQDGEKLWMKKQGNSGVSTNVNVWDSEFLNDGSVVTVGHYIGNPSELSFQGQTITSSNGLTDGFVMRQDGNSGSLNWLKTLGAPGYSLVFGAAKTANGVAIGGYFDCEELNYEGVSLLNHSEKKDPFILILDSDGKPTCHVENLGTEDHDQVSCLSTLDNDLYVFMPVIDSISFGQFTFSSLGSDQVIWKTCLPCDRISGVSEDSPDRTTILLENDPNPFSDYTDVQYEHDGCTDCQIIITDVSGRIIKRIRTEGTKGTVRVYSSEIGSGMFIYSLVKDGKTVSSERMISSNR